MNNFANLRNQKKIKPSEVKEYLQNEFMKTLESAGSCNMNYKDGELNIYFITGVNGAGKTTLIGKMAYRFKQEGKRVLIAAGDTFRAAAEEQADIWSKRSGADIVRRDKADPASVVYEAIQKARSENYDVILVDTAGRLQNKYNLMEELSKIRERGYAVDDEEIEPGLHCIAAPIFNHKRQPRMAISLSFPYGRIWDLDWEQAVQDVRYYARQISERVGYTEPVS